MILEDLKRGNNYPTQGELLFKSSDHIRYQNGQNVSGHNYGSNRAVKIEKNILGKEGYSVAIYNLDDNHPVWQNNVQMETKPMKITSVTNEKIVLRGFGYDERGLAMGAGEDASFAHYGLSVFLKSGTVDKIVLHMHDRSVDIEYFGDDKSQISTEPEIVSLAKKANTHFQQQNFSECRQLLVQIHRSVKSDPGQLNNVNDFSSLGIAFLFMLYTELSDDIDTLQMMASLSYLCISKAIEKDKTKIILYRDRLLLLRAGFEPFKYTVMSALDLCANGIMSFSSFDPELKARDAIYKMEIADLELHPFLYQQTPLFRDRKKDFDEKIARQFFMPERTLENVIKSGIENHKKLLNYLENRVLNEKDVDF